MKPLYELYAAASEFGFWIKKDLKALETHRDAMCREKDVSKIKVRWSSIFVTFTRKSFDKYHVCILFSNGVK